MKVNSTVTNPPVFVPMLFLNDLSSAIEFYKMAFGAIERWRIDNPDGSTHVAEMSIPPIVFRMHEEVSRNREFSPLELNATTIVMGLLVENPDAFAAKAVAAGATEISPVQDYEYGYRQGTVGDPFGHHWCIESLSDLERVPTPMGGNPSTP